MPEPVDFPPEDPAITEPVLEPVAPETMLEPAVGPVVESVITEPVPQEQLQLEIAELTLTVDAVLRLEPTISNRLRRISTAPATAISTKMQAPDGVFTRKTGHRLDATIEVAVRLGRPAADVAAEVQSRTRTLITDSGWEPGSVSVSVLAVEHPAGVAAVSPSAPAGQPVG